MTLKVRILRCSRRLFIILVSLAMTWFSEKMLISTRCIHGFMPILIKKSWMVTRQEQFLALWKPSHFALSFWHPNSHELEKDKRSMDEGWADWSISPRLVPLDETNQRWNKDKNLAPKYWEIKHIHLKPNRNYHEENVWYPEPNI